MLCLAFPPIGLVDPAQGPNLTEDISGVRHMRLADLEGADSPR